MEAITLAIKDVKYLQGSSLLYGDTEEVFDAITMKSCAGNTTMDDILTIFCDDLSTFSSWDVRYIPIEEIFLAHNAVAKWSSRYNCGGLIPISSLPSQVLTRKDM